ncbi:MAG: PAS domain-containing protein, partial [Caldimicrobium sp.]
MKNFMTMDMPISFLLNNKAINLIIESIPWLFFVTDEHFNLIYANRSFKDLLQIDVVEGKKCYEILCDRTAPCKGCPIPLLEKEGEDEVYSPKLGRYFKKIYKKVISPDGKVYTCILCIDITEE